MRGMPRLPRWRWWHSRCVGACVRACMRACVLVWYVVANNPYLQETVCGLVARHPVLRATILISRIDEPMRAHSPLPEAHVNDSGSSG